MYSATNKKNVVGCIADLLPMIVLSLVYHFFITTNNLLWNYPKYHLLPLSICAIMFATLNSTMNFARVTNYHFDRFSLQYVSVLLAIVPTFFIPNHLDLVVFAFLWIMITYSHFVFHVTNEIADALNIRIFKIKNKQV
jgi:hypothetical protein